MDKKKLETFKKRLETRQQELRHMVTRNQQDGRTVDDEATQDVADRAASSYNKEFLFSQTNNDRQLLNMVDSALARIRAGSFGECVSCGKEISKPLNKSLARTPLCTVPRHPNVFDHAATRAEQERVIQALRDKCDILWAQLDALYFAYVEPGWPPPGAFRIEAKHSEGNRG